MTIQPSKALETFPNPATQRDFRIHMEFPEYSCLCPKTGQPDLAMLFHDYVPEAAWSPAPRVELANFNSQSCTRGQ